MIIQFVLILNFLSKFFSKQLIKFFYKTNLLDGIEFLTKKKQYTTIKNRSPTYPPRQKWINQQKYITSLTILEDKFDWGIEKLNLVAGVDISFSSKYPNSACAGLTIYSIDSKIFLYQDFIYFILKQQYILGFLAFRQLPPTLELFRRLRNKKPDLWQQVILVDGNGILHKYQCGYACHLGEVLDLPTVGGAKTFFDFDSLHQSQVEQWLKDQLRFHGESITIKGKSGKQWCKAMLADEDQDKYIYLSIGNRISPSSATRIVLKLLIDDSPLPIKAIDRLTRKMICKMSDNDYKQAHSYEMDYLDKK